MTFLMYLLYAFIVIFIMLTILEVLKSRIVTPEKKVQKYNRVEYSHIEDDPAPLVEGAGGECSIVLFEVPVGKQIGVLNAIKNITHLNLKDAQVFIESAPITIKENIPQSEAKKIKEILEAAGATVKIKRKRKKNS